MGALTAGLLWLWPGTLAVQNVRAQAVPGGPADGIAKMFDALEAVREAIDRSVFDSDELALDLAFEDAEWLVAWVRDSIAFEAYAGVLRGPDGTLMARAGNAYDQAVLLAKLLGNAGYDVRVAEGTLSDEQADALLKELGRERQPRPTGIDLEQLGEALDDLAAVSGFGYEAIAGILAALRQPTVSDAELEQLDAYAAAQADAIRIRELLGAAGVEIGDPSFGTELVEEARHYAWVEYKLGSGDAWSGAHPAFGSALPEGLTEVVATRTFEDTVPGDLLHVIRIESTIERRMGNTIEAISVMQPWERPTATVVGVPITYMNVPGSLAGASSSAAGEALVKAESYFPVLMGAMAPGAQAFDLLGLTAPADVAADPAAGVFRSTAGAGARGATALGGIGGGSEAAAARLERHVLEITLTRPDGHSTTVERVLAQYDDNPEEMARSLAQRITLMVDVGAAPAAYAVDRHVDRLLALRHLAMTLASGSFDPEMPIGASGLMDGLDTSWAGHDLLFEVFRVGAESPADGSVSYRHAPALVAHSTRWTAEAFVVSIDVISNPRRVIRTDADVPTLDVTAMIAAGTWETHAEGALLPESESATSTDTMAAITDALAGGGRLQVLSAGLSGTLDGVDLDDQTLSNIRRDLEAGYAVIVPDSMPVNQPMAGWWRVSLADGETLGLTSDGRGQNLTTYQLLVGGVGILSVAGGALCLGGALGAWSSGLHNRFSGSLLTCLGGVVGGSGMAMSILCPPCGAVLGLVAGAIALLDIVLTFD